MLLSCHNKPPVCEALGGLGYLLQVRACILFSHHLEQLLFVLLVHLSQNAVFLLDDVLKRLDLEGGRHTDSYNRAAT